MMDHEESSLPLVVAEAVLVAFFFEALEEADNASKGETKSNIDFGGDGGWFGDCLTSCGRGGGGTTGESCW